MTFTIDVHLSWKNGLSVVAGVCVVLLAIIPLSVDAQHLSWMRWQIAIYGLMAFAVGSLLVQAILQSREDHKREQREIERDKRQESVENNIAELSRQLKSGTPRPTITENIATLEPPPSLTPEAPLDIDGEVYRLVMSPRSVAWPLVRDAFKMQGRPQEAKVDTDILVEMYLVNRNQQTPQHIKAIRLSAEVDGKRVGFAYQDDLLADPFADHDFEYALKVKESDRDDKEPLKRLFDKLPVSLAPKQPADGWARFMAEDINPDKITEGTIVITVVDSLGKEFTISKLGTDRKRRGEIALRRLG